MGRDVADLYWHEYANECKVLESVSARLTWVLGLRWLPTVGPRSRKLLVRQLQREQVRWWVCPSQRSATIGFLPALDAPELRVKESNLVCAAIMFALAHPTGTHVLKVTFGLDFYWLVGVHDGHVLSQTDCFFSSLERLIALQETICHRFADVTVYDVTLDTSVALAEALPFLLQRSLQSQAVLKRLGRSTPKLWWLGGAVVLIVFWYFDPRGATQDAGFDQSSVASQDVMRKRVIEMSDVGSLSNLMGEFSKLPVEVAGWQMRSVRCELNGEDAHCRTTYQRRSQQAINTSLKVVSALGWDVNEVTLDQTDFIRVLHWQTQRKKVAELFDSENSLKSPDSYSTDKQTWLVALQRFSGLAEVVDLGSPRGMTEFATDGLSQWPLRIRLPMRQVFRIEALRLPVIWKTVRLDMSLNVSAQTSRLCVTLEGSVVGHT